MRIIISISISDNCVAFFLILLRYSRKCDSRWENKVMQVYFCKILLIMSSWNTVSLLKRISLRLVQKPTSSAKEILIKASPTDSDSNYEKDTRDPIRHISTYAARKERNLAHPQYPLLFFKAFFLIVVFDSD